MTAQAGDTLNSAASQKQDLRRLVRRQRAAIPLQQQRRAADAAARRALRLPALRAARHVAVYLEVASELGTQPLLAALHASGKRVYVPKIGRDSRMTFVQLQASATLRANRFGIAEPAGRTRFYGARRLDVIVLPLCGFDAQGHRLGTGGGYYDRALAFARSFRKPFLLGYAYALQQLDAIPHDDWDIRLDAVITENKLHLFRTKD